MTQNQPQPLPQPLATSNPYLAALAKVFAVDVEGFRKGVAHIGAGVFLDIKEAESAARVTVRAALFGLELDEARSSSLLAANLFSASSGVMFSCSPITREIEAQWSFALHSEHDHWAHQVAEQIAVDIAPFIQPLLEAHTEPHAEQSAPEGASRARMDAAGDSSGLRL